MRIDNMMQKTILVTMMCLLLIPVSCGKKESGAAGQPEGYSAANQTATPTGDKESGEAARSADDNFIPPERPEIREVKFASQAIAGQDLTVDPHLAIPDPEVELDYRWFVNDQEIEDAEENVLLAENFKTGDWIHCRVKAIKNNLESRTIKSKYVKVLGAAPILKLQPVESFSVPGTFYYQIQAYDPAVGENIEAEENRMRYELISPLNVGIELDSQTGELYWELEEDTVNQLGKRIEIKFKVTSAQNVYVTSSITLNLAQQKESPEQKL
jgi:hypothetical protein